MSDYLGHLVERSFAPTPELRPRIPSRFEPPPATALIDTPVAAASSLPSPVVKRPTEPVRSEQTQPAVPETSLPQPKNSAAPAPAAPRGIDAPVHDAATRAARIIPATGLDDASPVDPSPDLPHNAPTNVPPVKAAAPPPSGPSHPLASDYRAVPGVAAPPEALPRTHEDNAAEKDSEPLHSSGTLPRALPREAKPSNPIVHLSNPARQTIIRPALIAEPKGSQHTPPPAYLVPVPAIRPVRETVVHAATVPGQKGSGRQPPPFSPVPVPEIHVTIGRVEVRATPPSAPLRAKSKKEPEMSLEAYLQRRAEGGRR
jgi:hypothetical protein